MVGVTTEQRELTLDAAGSNGGQYHYSYSVTKAGSEPYQFMVRNNGTDHDLILFSPFSVLVHPGDIYGNSTIVGTTATRIVISTQHNFTLTARDRYDNLLETGGNSTFFHFNFRNATDLTEVATTKASFDITDNCDGTYFVSYTGPSRKGTYLLEVYSYDSESASLLISSIEIQVINDCLPDPDCSNNGECISSVCVCQPGWTGPDCAKRTVCIPCSVAYGKGMTPCPRLLSFFALLTTFLGTCRAQHHESGRGHRLYDPGQRRLLAPLVLRRAHLDRGGSFPYLQSTL